MAKKTVIPASFALVDSPLVIDADNLGTLPGKRLYCTKQVQIGREVEAQALDRTIENLVVKDLLLYPKVLTEVLNRKAELSSDKGLAYEGELWLVKGRRHWWLPASSTWRARPPW